MKLTLNVPNKLVAALAMGGVGFAAGQVAATSFPSDGQQMHYSGLLADQAGRPQTGTEDITIAFFNAPSGGTRLCEASEDGVDLEASVGRFRVALPDDCSNAVRDHGDVYAQVTVGATTLPRQKLGATPYAVSARDAQSADFAVEAMNAASAAQVGPNGVGTTALAEGAVTTSKLAPSLASQISEHESRLDTLETEQPRAQVFASWRATGTAVANTPQKLKFTTVDSDQTSALDLVNSRFVAPSTGVYLVSGNWNTDNIADQCGYVFTAHRNETQFGATLMTRQSLVSGQSDNLGASLAHAIQLQQGDSVSFYSQSNCTIAIGAYLQITLLH